MFHVEQCLITDRRGRIPRWLVAVCLTVTIMRCVNAGESAQQPTTGPAAVKQGWGTYLKPFAASSLWNSRPDGPVLGEFIIPTSDYFPAVGEGPYSLGVFLAKAGDAAMTVRAIDRMVFTRISFRTPRQRARCTRVRLPQNETFNSHIFLDAAIDLGFLRQLDR